MNEMPKTVGHYDLLDELGYSDFYIVYFARDRRTGQHVALRLLGSRFLGKAAARLQFINVAEQAATYQHPNIMPVLETGMFDDQPYMAMEYVHGITLQQWLDQVNRVVAPAEAIAIVNQIAEGLDYIHRLNGLHGSVRARNIFITEDGRAILSDVGLIDASLAACDGNYALIYPEVEDLAYCSPEQVRGDMILGVQSDIYSLGVTTYRMLTGELPFRATDSNSMLRAVSDELPIPPEAADKTISPGIAYVLRSVMAKQPSIRYGTASEYSHALSDGLQWTRLGTGAATGDGYASSASADQQSGSRRRWPALLLGVALLAVIAVVLFLFGTRSDLRQRIAEVAGLPAQTSGEPETEAIGEGTTATVDTPTTTAGGAEAAAATVEAQTGSAELDTTSGADTDGGSTNGDTGSDAVAMTSAPDSTDEFSAGVADTQEVGENDTEDGQDGATGEAGDAATVTSTMTAAMTTTVSIPMTTTVTSTVSSTITSTAPDGSELVLIPTATPTSDTPTADNSTGNALVTATISSGAASDLGATASTTVTVTVSDSTGERVALAQQAASEKVTTVPTAMATSTLRPTFTPRPSRTPTLSPTPAPPTATSTRTPRPTATSTKKPTATPVPPTATRTKTPQPSATFTLEPTATPPPPTATSVPATATRTKTPASTATSEPTDTSVPPTETATRTPRPTATRVRPTATKTPRPTATRVPPTATSTRTPRPTATPVPPTATATRTPRPTNTPVPPTATATRTPRPTATPIPATATATRTPRPTATLVPPTATSTNTPIPPTPTATYTPTAVPVDTSGLQLLMPGDGSSGGGSQAFEWRTTIQPAEGQAFELVFWPVGADPIGKGFGLAAPTTNSRISVNLDSLDAALGDLLQPGDYYWGLILVQTDPYQRLQYLEQQRTFRYVRDSSSSGGGGGITPGD